MNELTQVRRNALAELLIREGWVSTAEQAAKYEVTTETIRKDLMYLESIGLAQKTYGGAVIAADCPERGFSQKAADRPDIKRRIAQKSLELIPSGAAVILDSGSTLCALAELAVITPKHASYYTNSIKAAQILIDAGAEVTMLGGTLRRSSNAATGAQTLRQLSQLRADIAFLGATGFDARGAYVESMEEAEIKRAMIEASDRKIILADSSKDGMHSKACFCDWSTIDQLITDAAPKSNYTETILA